jgi:hypothetical protein
MNPHNTEVWVRGWIYVGLWNLILCCWVNVPQRSFKILGTTYQITQHHSLEGMNLRFIVGEVGRHIELTVTI